MPDEQVPAAAALLRQLVHKSGRRTFRSDGIASAEPDLGERAKELALLQDVAERAFTVVDTTAEDLDRICQLVDKYSDLPLGTVHASVIAVG